VKANSPFERRVMPAIRERHPCPKCRMKSSVSHCKSPHCSWAGCYKCNIIFSGKNYFRWDYS
jgi:hypothetical protein